MPTVPLGDYDGKGSSVLDFTVRFLNQLISSKGRDPMRQIFARIVPPLNDVDVATVCGTLEVGGYGTGGRLVDVDTTKDVHIRQRKHAELHPFYFLIYCPPAEHKGVLIIQRLGHDSPLVVFDKAVTSAFAGAQKPYRMNIGRIVPTELLRRYLTQGDLKSLEFTFGELPPDVADDMGYTDGAKPKIGRFKSTILSEHGVPLLEPRWLRDIRQGKPFPTHITMHGVEVDEAAVEVNFGGKRRRVVVSDMGHFRGSVDITEAVVMDSNNLPTFASVDVEAQALLADIRLQEGI